MKSRDTLMRRPVRVILRMIELSLMQHPMEYLPVVEFLIDHGVDIHTENDRAT